MQTAKSEYVTRRYYLSGLDCVNCATKLEQALQKIAGLEHVQVSFATKSLELPVARLGEASKVVSAVEPGVRLLASLEDEAKGMTTPGPKLMPIGLSLVLLAFGLILGQDTSFGLVSLAVAYLVVGWPIIRVAGRNLFAGRVLDEYSLMTIATFGAIAIRELPEAVVVMAFYSVGEYAQEKAVDRSRRSITALLNLRPDHANLQEGENIRRVTPQEVVVGQVIVIRPGERLPLDGVLDAGESFLDTSPLTGESVPRKVRVGDSVLAGAINQTSPILVRVTKKYADSTVAKILEMVERASERKAPAERFISNFARYYTPAVVGSAVLVAVLPPLLIPGQSYSVWLYRALVMLVISCPCALVVSVPLSYFGGIGAASRQGILFKGANYLDALSKMHTVIFDKTGTLTKGTFKVLEVRPHHGYSREEVLALAAKIERHSTHPVAKAISEAVILTDAESPAEIVELAGRGMMGRLHGKELLVGNARLLREQGVDIASEVMAGGTVVLVALDRQLVGEILVADEVKGDARQAVRDLKQLGARHISMLTGDYMAPALQVSRDLGLDDFQAELLPQQKVYALEALQKALRPKYDKLIFVGDGINDAPVIARADVGIAMGGLGSDAAIEAADVVIMQDAPSKVATAVRLSRFTSLIVRQNVALSLGVKFVFMLLGLFDLTTIAGAVFADVGVTLLAIANAMRVLRYNGSTIDG
ncbi:MAG: Zinc-transporting ATPase [Firmicutes bacterium]|nr:Zinc-transporting ATPase [Bacillota bacterium]